MSGKTQETNNSYLLISYFEQEEYFSNAIFFIPISHEIEMDNESQLITIINDTINRIYYEIDYFIVHNVDSLDFVKGFIDSIKQDSSSIIYSSRHNNLIIQLIKTKDNMEKFYWDQRSPTAIPYFSFTKSQGVRRRHIRTKGRMVLKNIK